MLTWDESVNAAVDSHRSLVVLPTYNERDNIEPIVTAILDQSPDFEVLVVDDNSPDGTGDIVDRLSQANPRVHVMHRAEKSGLGTAYIEAFEWALARDYAYIFEMDADFSHDPAAIGDFLEAAKDADIVLGSRYLHGVTVVNWPLSRLILSFSANVYTRIITGMPVVDATGGFKCFRRRALEGIRLDRVRTEGYGFQIEMSFRAWKRGFRIKEIPIVFVDRRAGISKMNRRIIIEAAWLVWKLRFLDLFGRLE